MVCEIVTAKKKFKAKSVLLSPLCYYKAIHVNNNQELH